MNFRVLGKTIVGTTGMVGFARERENASFGSGAGTTAARAALREDTATNPTATSVCRTPAGQGELAADDDELWLCDRRRDAVLAVQPRRLPTEWRNGILREDCLDCAAATCMCAACQREVATRVILLSRTAFRPRLPGFI